MKKYTDWQKYVKEQTEKLNRARQERGEQPAQRKQVPSIDDDRYVIHKKEASTGPDKGAGKDKPRTKAGPPADTEQRKPFSGATRKNTEDQDQAANPIASPFVSVQDVWKSAEKTAHKRPAQRKDQEARQTTRIRPAPTPEINKVKPGRIDTAAPGPTTREESREEVLERLMNPTINLEEAAKIMGVCKATVRRYTSMGILPHYRTPGNQRRFKLNDVIQFLENQRR